MSFSSISVGSHQDADRASRHEKARQHEQSEFQRRKADLEQIGSKQLVKDLNRTFEAHTNTAEQMFKLQTVGLVTHDEYKTKQNAVNEFEVELQKQKEKEQKKLRKKRKKESKKMLATLSFVDDDDEEAESLGIVPPKSKRNKTKGGGIKKNPTVDTSFLPDKEREAILAAEKQRLIAEWSEGQSKLKAQMLEVTYSYWDGSGHRRTTQVDKGTTILQFLDKVRKELLTSFPELKALSSVDLMYVKEDLIIPANYSFYDLIVTKARGKSGPLFHFDVHDDVRLEGNAKIEKDESHAGKVMSRTWYDRNKHVFPASRWEMYDPSKTFDSYTIKS